LRSLLSFPTRRSSDLHIRRLAGSSRLLSASNNRDTIHRPEHNLGLRSHSSLLQQRSPIRGPVHHPPCTLSPALWNRNGLQHLHSDRKSTRLNSSHVAI